MLGNKVYFERESQQICNCATKDYYKRFLGGEKHRFHPLGPIFG